jgi:hypothetical protein
MLVLLRWSKTNQFGQKVLRLPLVANPGNILCPIRAYSKMIQLTPAPESSPAFVIQQLGGLVPVKYGELQQILRKLVGLTGRDPDLYSSHSLRRGGATCAFQAKVPGELIQLHGDWVSDAYKQYLHIPYQTKLTVSSSLNLFINSNV